MKVKPETLVSLAVLQNMSMLQGSTPAYTADIMGEFMRSIKHKTKMLNDCPVCGKERTNIYYKDKKWQCKKCWDKERCSKCINRLTDEDGDSICGECKNGSLFVEQKLNE